MELTTDKFQELLLRNKHNTNILGVGDTIMDAASEAGIDKNWYLFDNQSTRNAFINEKYLLNTKNYLDGKCLHVHCNVGVTYTNKIGDLTG